MPDPNNTRVYRGTTGLQSKVPSQGRGRGASNSQQSTAMNAHPPGGVGVRAPWAPGSGMDADPPLGLGIAGDGGGRGATLADALGVSTPDAPDISTS